MSHSRQTEHYELPLYDGTDIINPLTDFNNANETIDEALYNANQRSVQAETTANEAKDIAEGYDARVTQAIDTANNAITLANNTQDMIADEFDPMKEGGYQVGDFVIYNGVLYRFINAHTGAWDASDVQVSPVLIDAIADVVDEGKQAIEEAVEEAEEEIAGQTEKVTKTQAMIAQPFDENKAGGYAIDDIVTYADKLYKFTSVHSGAWTGLDVKQITVIETVNEKVDNLTAVENVTWSVNYGSVNDEISYAIKCGKMFECFFSVVASSAGGRCEIVIPHVLSAKSIMGIARNTGTGEVSNVIIPTSTTSNSTAVGATLAAGYNELRFQFTSIIND